MLLHRFVNAVFTAVGTPALGSWNNGPWPRNLQMSCTLSQSARVREYASIVAITSSMPSFSLPPIACERMGAVMIVFSTGRYASRSAAASALNPPASSPELALVACA